MHMKYTHLMHAMAISNRTLKGDPQVEGNAKQSWNAATCVVGVKKAELSGCHSSRLPKSSPISASSGDPTLRLPLYWHLCLHPISHLPAIIHHPLRSIGGHAFISPWVLMGKRRARAGGGGGSEGLHATEGEEKGENV